MTSMLVRWTSTRTSRSYKTNMPGTPPSIKPSSPNAEPISSEKKPKYVLDAFALFALIQKEDGEKRVAELLDQAQQGRLSLYLSLINWGEILYTIRREQGAELADEMIHDLDNGPILLAEVNRARVEAAAHIKSRYAVSYGDAFAIALAQELGATVVTGDREFKAVEQAVPVLWL